MELRLERLNENNLQDLPQLFGTVFGKRRSLNYFHEKYGRSPTGKTHLGFLCYDGNKAIAFHGSLPVLMRYERGYEVAAQMVDAMVLKSYRGKGIMSDLTLATLEMLRNEGVSFGFCFLGDNYEKAYVRNGWMPHSYMQCYTIPVKAFPYERILRRMGWTNSYRKICSKKIAPLTTKAEDLQLTLNDSVRTVRDESFYASKAHAGSFFVGLNGTVAWIKPSGALSVGDIYTRSEQEYIECVHALMPIAASLGLNKLVLQVMPGTMEDQILRRYYTGFQSWLISYYPLMTSFPMQKLCLTYGDIDTF